MDSRKEDSDAVERDDGHECKGGNRPGPAELKASNDGTLRELRREPKDGVQVGEAEEEVGRHGQARRVREARLLRGAVDQVRSGPECGSVVSVF